MTMTELECKQQAEIKQLKKAKAKMKKEAEETADRLARTALSVMDDYKEAAEEIKQLKEEIRERERERYAMWKTYCVFQDPDIWDDEEDYSKNLNSSYTSTCQHPNSDDEDE